MRLLLVAGFVFGDNQPTGLSLISQYLTTTQAAYRREARTPLGRPRWRPHRTVLKHPHPTRRRIRPRRTVPICTTCRQRRTNRLSRSLLGLRRSRAHPHLWCRRTRKFPLLIQTRRPNRTILPAWRVSAQFSLNVCGTLGSRPFLSWPHWTRSKSRRLSTGPRRVWHESDCGREQRNWLTNSRAFAQTRLSLR